MAYLGVSNQALPSWFSWLMIYVKFLTDKMQNKRNNGKKFK